MENKPLFGPGGPGGGISSKPPTPEVKKTTNPWGSYGKVSKKSILGKITGRKLYEKTGGKISGSLGKKILERTLGKGDYIQKEQLNKEIKKAKAKLGGSTREIQKEGADDLKCLLHVKKSIEE